MSDSTNIFGSAPMEAGMGDPFGTGFPAFGELTENPFAPPTDTPTQVEQAEAAVEPNAALDAGPDADVPPSENSSDIADDATFIPAVQPNTPAVTTEQAGNPLDAVMQQAEGQAYQSIFTLPPVFSHGGAEEDITDKALTFEDLRLDKSEDFPELQDGSKVTWAVSYGVVKKSVSTPKTTKIQNLKHQIEASKEFIDGLKKSKDKQPRCLVKPSIAMQRKGKMPDYKGCFTSLEEARASDKVITLFPSGDGLIYERRVSELGEFITLAGEVSGMEHTRAGFTPALPPIPYSLLSSVIAFFRACMSETANYEALVNVYWDRRERQYCIDVPPQSVTGVTVETNLTDGPDETRYLHYADIHSHHAMPARFSPQDDRDEQATRLYIVIGRLNDFFPKLSARISNGGKFLDVRPELVLESLPEGAVCAGWLDQVTVAAAEKRVV